MSINTTTSVKRRKKSSIPEAMNPVASDLKKNGRKTTPVAAAIAASAAHFLLIVESPSKIKKIEEYLDSMDSNPRRTYKCIACNGHIRSILSIKDIHTKDHYMPNFQILPTKQAHIEKMRAVISTYPIENIILATDNDREGEAIAYHLCCVFGLPIETTKRIVFNEITKAALQTAIANPRTIHLALVHSQIARQIIDIMIGFKISPTLWKHVYFSKASKNSLSAGRCQTCALRLIYMNHLEGHAVSDSITRKYKTTGYFTTFLLPFELSKDFETAQEVEQFLESSKSYLHILTIGKQSISTRSPPTPFNTSRLLQAANSQLHYSTKTTMMQAQKLYQEGKITYMRTESTQYSQEFLQQAQSFITNKYGKEYVREGNTSSRDSTSPPIAMPHEAIRVTHLEYQEDDHPLYRLIWRNTVESCMEKSTYHKYLLKIRLMKSPEDVLSLYYQHTLENPVFLGWEIVHNKEKPHQNMLFYLQSLGTNPILPFQYIESKMHIHNSWQHYSESSLISKLEELEIGRPSTYSKFIETILERSYVIKTDILGIQETCTDMILRKNSKNIDGVVGKSGSEPQMSMDIEYKTSLKTFGQEKNKLVIQPLGIVCMEFLWKHFQELFDFDYSKNMESELDKIASISDDCPTEHSWSDLCDRIHTDILRLLKPLSKLTKPRYMIDDTHEFWFGPYGCSIKHTKDDGTIEYLPMKSPEISGMEFDMALLSTSPEYARSWANRIDELIETNTQTRILGNYLENPVYVKNGKFGHYLEWTAAGGALGESESPSPQTKSLRPYYSSDTISQITLEDAIAIIENRREEQEGYHRMSNEKKTILRVVDVHTSVRQGRFGTYIFHQPPNAKKPMFFSIKKNCPFQYMNCEKDVILDWIHQQMVKSPPNR